MTSDANHDNTEAVIGLSRLFWAELFTALGILVWAGTARDRRRSH
jgi:hypothetical protein